MAEAGRERVTASTRNRAILAAGSIALSAAYAAYSVHSTLWLDDQPLSLVDLLCLPYEVAHALGIAAICGRSSTCPSEMTFLVTGVLAALTVSVLGALAIPAVKRRVWSESD